MTPRRTALVALLLSLGCGVSNNATGAADYAPRLGVAVQTAGGVCFSIRNAHLAVNSPLTLVTPSDPQSVVEAEVTGASDVGCPGVKDPHQSGYRLRVVKGAAPDFMPLIGAPGSSARFRQQGGAVVAHLDGDGTAQSFRSCTSADGVHLTVWQGKPLEGVRLWHQYYYLGQDLDPNCTGKDTAQ